MWHDFKEAAISRHISADAHMNLQRLRKHDQRLHKPKPENTLAWMRVVEIKSHLYLKIYCHFIVAGRGKVYFFNEVIPDCKKYIY